MSLTTIGETIRQFRRRIGLSQVALIEKCTAEKCKLSLRELQRIESGVTTPRPRTIRVLARLMEVEAGAADLAAVLWQLARFSELDLKSIDRRLCAQDREIKDLKEQLTEAFQRLNDQDIRFCGLESVRNSARAKSIEELLCG